MLSYLKNGLNLIYNQLQYCHPSYLKEEIPQHKLKFTIKERFD